MAELVGGLAVLFEVSLALTKETLTDHATFNGVVASLSAPLACFFVSSGVGHCGVQ
jgi:hypothetical protein